MITPHLPSPFTGRHVGDVIISGPREIFELRGTIVGNVAVRDEGMFLNYGMVTLNVDVDDNSTAVIAEPGIVDGILTGAGRFQNFGGIVNNRS